MEEIEDSVTAKDYINKVIDCPDETKAEDKLRKVSNEIGSAISKIHKHNIVHGDLTTSNMLVKEDATTGFVSELFLIDFGLGQLDPNPEEKGVDLYVLERALLSTHKDSEKIFKLVLEAYKRSYKGGCDEVISKLDDARARGRRRTMVG